jgi:hypothetical protein
MKGESQLKHMLAKNLIDSSSGYRLHADLCICNINRKIPVEIEWDEVEVKVSFELIGIDK